jgi:hypothetical protein
MRNIYYDIRRHFSNLCYYIRKFLHLPDPVDFKYVDIVFENCDMVRIPPRLVRGLVLRDIYKNIYTNFCQQFIDVNYCREFEITLENEALGIIARWQSSKDDYSNSFENHIKVYKDITHIAVKLNKGKEVYIGIPYKTKGKDYCDTNLLQKNKFDKKTFTISAKEK